MPCCRVKPEDESPTEMLATKPSLLTFLSLTVEVEAAYLEGEREKTLFLISIKYIWH